MINTITSEDDIKLLGYVADPGIKNKIIHRVINSVKLSKVHSFCIELFKVK
jgi:hypothetical protein